MKKLLIFAGTTEGRELGERFKTKYDLTLSVATQYGSELAGENAHCARMNEEEMSGFIGEHGFNYVVDATHPYAKEVSSNVMHSCEKMGVKLIRLLRGRSEMHGCIPVANAKDCTKMLESLPGNILLTTGSKELDVYTAISDYEQRMFVRVLPTEGSVKRAVDLGYKTSNIIAMQGPFFHELNVALIRQFDISILVSKDGGYAGGFSEKLSAARQTGAKMIVISRPEEEGADMKTVVAFLEENA